MKTCRPSFSPLCAILLLLAPAAFLVSAQESAPARKSTVPAKVKVAKAEKVELPVIEKISLQGPPLLWGGFSFYADRKGQVVVQSIKPAPGQGKTNYAETRTIIRGQPELFAHLADGLDLVALLSHPKGRDFPVPEEITKTFELTLSNGARIVIRKLSNETLQPIDDLDARIRAAQEAATKIQKPETLDYDPKDFAAFEKILKVE